MVTTGEASSKSAMSLLATMRCGETELRDDDLETPGIELRHDARMARPDGDSERACAAGWLSALAVVVLSSLDGPANVRAGTQALMRIRGMPCAAWGLGTSIEEVLELG